MTRMYPTAYLEHHADQYASAMLYKHGITLDQYLADPARYQELITRPFPLLPAQTRARLRIMQDEQRAEARELFREEVERQLEKELDDFPRNNVRPFEPMRHHRFPKKRGFACGFKRTPNTPHPTRG